MAKSGGAFTENPNRERERLDFIDALRGFACLWVLVHHSFESLPANVTTSVFPFNVFAPVARIGWLGVSLFLVLSGFCLYYPLVRRTEPRAVNLNLKQFARRRAMRILPPYMAVVALFTGIAWYGVDWIETVRTRDLVTHVFMVHNFFPSTFASINPALWSLALEVQLYIIFPLFVWLAAKKGLKTLAAFSFLVAVSWQTVVWLKYGFSLQWQAPLAVAYHALPARCFEFAAGMIAAAVVARSRGRVAGAGEVQQAGGLRYGRPEVCATRRAKVRAALLVFALAGPALWFVLSVSRFGPLCDQVWGIIFASAVVLLSTLPQAVWSGSGLRWLTALGTVSYSVYLVHQPLIQFLAPEHLHISATSASTAAVFMVLRLAIAVAIGVVFFHLLEKPCILRAGRVARPTAPLPGSATQQAT